MREGPCAPIGEQVDVDDPGGDITGEVDAAADLGGAPRPDGIRRVGRVDDEEDPAPGRLLAQAPPLAGVHVGLAPSAGRPPVAEPLEGIEPVPQRELVRDSGWHRAARLIADADARGLHLTGLLTTITIRNSGAS